MTDRELMQQALDALINAKGYIFHNVLDDKANQYDTAVEALRARLAQSEPDVGVCCQEFDKCLRSCTPRGQWIAHVRCGCGDQIMRDDGAECGTCVTARNAVKGEWQTLTDEEIGSVIEASQITLKNYCSEDKQTEYARAIEAKLKEKNT